MTGSGQGLVLDLDEKSSLRSLSSIINITKATQNAFREIRHRYAATIVINGPPKATEAVRLTRLESWTQVARWLLDIRTLIIRMPTVEAAVMSLQPHPLFDATELLRVTHINPSVQQIEVDVRGRQHVIDLWFVRLLALTFLSALCAKKPSLPWFPLPTLFMDEMGNILHAEYRNPDGTTTTVRNYVVMHDVFQPLFGRGFGRAVQSTSSCDSYEYAYLPGELDDIAEEGHDDHSVTTHAAPKFHRSWRLVFGINVPGDVDRWLATNK